MRGTFLGLALASLALLFGATGATAAERVELQTRWEPGRYALTQEAFISLFVKQDGKETDRSQSRALFSWNLDAGAVENGVQKLTLKATRVMLRFENAGKETAYYDSASNQSSPFVKTLFAQLQTVPAIVTVKDGKIDAVEGYDAFWSKIESPTEPADANFLAQLKGCATPASFAELFAQLAYPLPSEPVAVGDSWTTKTDYPMPVVGDTTFVWDCQLKAISKIGTSRVATVVADSEITLDLREAGTGVVKTELEAKYDITTGRNVEYSSKATMNVVRGKSGDKQNPEEKTNVLIRNKLAVAKL